MEKMSFNISKMPFSRYGSFIGISAKENNDVFIHSARRPFGEDKVFCMTFWDDDVQIKPQITFYPNHLLFSYKKSTLLIYINGENSLIMHNNGLDVKLCLVEFPSKNGDVPEVYPLAYGSMVSENHIKIISVNTRYCIGIHFFEGNGELNGPLKTNDRGELTDNKSIVRIKGNVICEIDIEPHERHVSTFIIPNIESDLKKILVDWEQFLAKKPKVSKVYEASSLRSWFNLWSSTVPACGNYKTPAVVMSMEFMSSVWSWDHCFNALALANSDMKSALEQFFIPFECQAPNGALPDYVNPDLEIVWGVTKPPIHGWCFSKLMKMATLDRNILQKAYHHLELWTNWWMDYNDVDLDGVPDYPMGCDSGWDNSSVFDLGYYVESPDLSAFLVIQMNTLSDIALSLGLNDESVIWKRRSNNLLALLDQHCWVNGCYVAKVSHTHMYDENPTSLITIMPLILGNLLPVEKRNLLIARLRSMFLTKFGLATEWYDGPYYKPDNYWRGSIWAPSTYLIVDGLINAGEIDLALEIARSFCDMIAFTAEGDYENFNALTGEGLRASGYTWTSSVNILFQTLLHMGNN